jgi:hypothetical protein
MVLLKSLEGKETTTNNLRFLFVQYNLELNKNNFFKMKLVFLTWSKTARLEQTSMMLSSSLDTPRLKAGLQSVSLSEDITHPKDTNDTKFS